MNIGIKRLCKLLECCETSVRVYMCRYPKIHYSPKTKMYYNIDSTDLTEIKALLHRPRKKEVVYTKVERFEVKNKMKKSDYEALYDKPNQYRQVASRCFDFNYSYDIEHKNTCLANYDNPCICKVLQDERCDFLFKQLGAKK